MSVMKYNFSIPLFVFHFKFHHVLFLFPYKVTKILNENKLNIWYITNGRTQKSGIK